MKKKIITLVVAVVVIVTAIFAMTACQKTKEPVAKAINIKLTDEEYAFGVDKAQTELRTQINSIIAEMKGDGSLEAIMNKYFNGAEVEGIVSATKDLSKKDKQLVVATNAEFPPFEYKMGDKFAGVDMEIAKVLAEKLDMELVIEDMDFDAVVTSVGKNGVDVGMAGLTVNEKRKESVDFTDTYYNASQVLVVKIGETKFDSCTTVAEVEALLKEGNYKIGVQRGTTGQYYVEGDADFEFEGFANIDCKSYDNAGLAVRDMLNGNIDFVIVDEQPAKFIVNSVNS